MSVKSYSIRQLIQANSEYQLEIKLILRHILGLSATELIFQHDRVLILSELELFLECLKDWQRGIPINYILGYKEFYSREFSVTPDTLIPRPETELLVEQVIRLVTGSSNTILDLGTGSGCIAVTLKLECQSVQVTAVDNYIDTLYVAIANTKRLNADVEFILSDWYDNLEGRNFNIIVSNPPYIHSESRYLVQLQHEPQVALTDFNDGLDCLRRVIYGAPKHLLPDGWLVVEHGYDQKISVQELFEQSGFTMINTVKDYANFDRITLGRVN